MELINDKSKDRLTSPQRTEMRVHVTRNEGRVPSLDQGSRENPIYHVATPILPYFALFCPSNPRPSPD